VTPQTRRPLLRISDLAVSFDGVQAVDGVSLTVHGGQTLAVVGESGCGKSVTALSVLRLVPTPPGRVDRGRIEFAGTDLRSLSTRQMRRVRGGDIAMIFQEPMTALNPVYTVGDQIAEAVRRHQRVGRRRAWTIAAKACAEVGIPEPDRRLRSYPHEFSGGMRQRAMIAMALACEPRLLLADEPTTALDVTIQAQILDLIGELRRSRNLAVMLITHDLGLVAEHADVACVVYAGRVVEYASVRDLLRRRCHPYTRALLACTPDMSRRRPMLTTVREMVSSPAAFKLLGDHDVVPWWPDHDPPEHLERDDDGGDYRLVEIEPRHWVGCWRTKAVAKAASSPPDIPVDQS
jgi:ABC-type dipeptide/oligopeptide/nickel transport system ATPase component